MHPRGKTHSMTEQTLEFLQIILTAQKVVKYQSSRLNFLHTVRGTHLHYLKNLSNRGIPHSGFTFVYAAKFQVVASP